MHSTPRRTRFYLLAFILFLPCAAYALTNKEAECYSSVQGKVEWQKNGSKTWNDANVHKLCKGVQQPSKRITCFQNGIRDHNNWQKAIEDCIHVSTSVKSLSPVESKQSSNAQNGSMAIIEPPTAQMKANSHNILSPYKSSDPGATDLNSSSSFGPCRTCVFVLERIRKGSNMIPTHLCAEMHQTGSDGRGYQYCNQVVNALSQEQSRVNLRYWLFEGCYRYEVYGAKVLLNPCPSHVICSALKDLGNQSFCSPPKIEDPFHSDNTGLFKKN